MPKVLVGGFVSVLIGADLRDAGKPLPIVIFVYVFWLGLVAGLAALLWSMFDYAQRTVF